MALVLENFSIVKGSMLWKISINLNGKITLEAIENESGFRNRSTFIINFKGVGENPSEYFKSIISI
jgi:hypothetical protein